jgi:hypothetical protein
MLGAPSRTSELDRLRLEVRDRAERRRDGDLQRSRRRQAGPDRKRRRELSLEAGGRSTEPCEFGGDRGDVARPAAGFLVQGSAVGSATRRPVAIAGGQADPVGRRAVEPDSPVEGDR